MGAADLAGKIVLVFINIFVVIFGLIFLAIGIFLRVAVDKIIDQVDPLLENLPSISSAVNIAGVTAPPYLDDDSLDPPFDLNVIFTGISTAFIVLGVFLLVVGILGCVGACCTVKVALIAYAVIVGLLFLGKLIVVICIVRGAFDGRIRGYMRDTIVKKYGGIDHLGLESVVWNLIMIKLKCCGIDDYHDFDEAEKWQSTREFEVSGITVETEMVTPVACCKMDGTFPSVEPVDDQCSITPTDPTSNWNSGCWSALKKELNNQDSYLVAGLVVIFLLEVACVVIAIIILWKSGSSKVAPV